MIKLTFIIILLYWLQINRNSEKAVSKYNYVIAGLFFLMMGLRNEAIFGDTYGYVQNFWNLQDMTIQQIIWRWPKDSFFYIFAHYLHPIVFHNYTVWLLVIAALYMYPMYIIVKRYSVNPMFSWVCFIFIGLMTFNMAGLRQTMAFGLVMTAFLMLMDGKKKYFFGLIAAAYLFHGTSLICLLYYPLSKLQFNKTMIKLYVVGLAVLMVMGVTVLQALTAFLGESDERFIGYGENMLGSNYTYMIQQALLVLPSLYILRHRFTEPMVALFANFSMMSFLFISMSPVIAEMFRVSMYFSWANMLLFPMAMAEVSKRNNTLPSLYIAFFVLYLIFVNKTAWQEYYFWFEDTSHIIRNFYIE